MGRVIKREVVALNCELRSCRNTKWLLPLSIHAPWQLQLEQLNEAIEDGWVVVLNPQLRSYCPQHAERAIACSCRTNPSRAHLCVVHTKELANRVWSEHHPVPEAHPVFSWPDEAIAA